jgi:hypothetical protein
LKDAALAPAIMWSDHFQPFFLLLIQDFLEDAQLEVCQANCDDSNRLTGPTRMTGTRQHPWKAAAFPSNNSGFCKLGCQIFYADVPKNTTCKRLCGYFYRYKVTAQYSDLAEEARLECEDGCDIALQVCQAGYFCNTGIMLPCPPGTYREAVKGTSILQLETAKECTACPYGRYSSTQRGKNADDCSKCLIGTYANVTGSILQSDCKRCPAGKNAEEEGMRLCKCITSDSCDLIVEDLEYFANGVDYYRETVPFIGRW